tara:strand:+ start:802 stop:1440 length:639 start_codon:yes stop_codon:yes gene_type:complete
MKHFDDIKSLAEDFKKTGMQNPRCPNGNIFTTVKLVGATLTIRCYPSQSEVTKRATQLVSAYNAMLGGTSSYKEWKKAKAAATPKTKRAPFSWIIAKEFLAAGEIYNALSYFTSYDKQPIFCAGFTSINDQIICEAVSVLLDPRFVSGRLSQGKWCIFHKASGMSLGSITESSTRAGAVKLLGEYDQEKLEASLKRVESNTFQADKAKELGL